MLTSVDLQQGLTVISRDMFRACTGLSSVAIPSSVTRIGWDAFAHCTGLKTVDFEPGLSVIGSGMFRDCTGLGDISIPSSVTSIGGLTFGGCSGLSSILVGDGSQKFASEGGVLFDAAKTTLIQYPPAKVGTYTIPAGVFGIDYYAFNGCGALTEVIIPASVTSIGLGRSEFHGCSALTSITVDEGNLSFSSEDGVLFDAAKTRLNRCPAGKSGDYVIPASVSNIVDYALWSCIGLSGVSIPPSVTRIGYYAFKDCIGLARVDIPASVTYIADRAFDGCSGLVSIRVDGGNIQYASEDGVLFNVVQTELIHFPGGKTGDYAIPSSVTQLDPDAFEGCAGLAGVTIPPSVTAINYYAFQNCTRLSRAMFLGDAPGLGSGAFDSTAADFTIYYLSTSIGFTSPTWNGYPAEVIDVEGYPAAPWLLQYGMPIDTELHQDMSGDGVSLLMAYALNLDPRSNLRGCLPVPVLGEEVVSMSFSAVAAGVTYRTETSIDLREWTDEGVLLSDPGPDGQRSASVGRDLPSRFLRLLVTEDR